MAIVLASNSVIRRTLLGNAGVDFTACDSGVDEDAVKQLLEGSGPQAIAIALAEAKARTLSKAQPGSLIIGADQTLGLDDQIFDKPYSIVEARRQLHALKNKTHQLFSAICCTRNEKVLWSHCGVAHLTMRNFSDAFVEDYLLTIAETYSTSVGGYKLEERGITLFDRIDGDYFTILGLPLLPLLKFLRHEEQIPS